MSLQAAFYGAAFRDGESRESKSGSKYGTLLAIVPNGSDENGNESTVMVRVLAFQDNVEELAKLKAWDRVYVEGNLTIKIWEGEKGPRPDLTLRANFVRRTQIGRKPDRSPKPEPEHFVNAINGADRLPAFLGPPPREPRKIVGRDDFNDRLDNIPYLDR
jgi:hypothetical protein